MPSQATARSRPTAAADALHSLSIRLLRTLRTEDAKTGVSPGRLSALSVLVFGGSQRLTDLARIEQVKAPTMTKIVAGMEAEGLVRRRTERTDARVVRLVATARGRRILQQGRARRVDRLARALERLPVVELDVLEEATTILRRVVETL
jgi:DNA-binding MarR family transcriptional regulator